MKVRDLKLGKMYMHKDSGVKVRINASGIFGTMKIGISYNILDNGQMIKMEHKIYDGQLEELTEKKH